MREIKFRAYCSECKVMFDELETIQVFATNGDGTIAAAHYDENKDWHDCEMLQFTGLHDKNGTEIYEGDVVSADGFYLGDSFIESNVGVIKYGDGCFYSESNVETFGVLDKSSIYNYSIEVIGNIHKNPELITQPPE